MSNDMRRLIGLILIVIGALWLVFTGLCTVSVALFIFQSYGPTMNDFVTIVAVAGGSTLLGWAVYAMGKRLRRS
ncbi:MAG: hypothetical protein KBA31_01295 [Alphaproteobacteria bacterium]|nr:hypothetical protein [Alphaproteobacteria bacterium]